MLSLAGCNYRKATEVSFEEEIGIQLTQLAATETAFAQEAGDGGGESVAQDLSATETALAACPRPVGRGHGCGATDRDLSPADR